MTSDQADPRVAGVWLATASVLLVAASLSGFAVVSLLFLVSGSRLAGTGWMRSAWPVVFVGALWTLTTALTEVTVIADLAASGDLSQFEAWWSFAEGNGTVRCDKELLLRG
jgi:hypothetical protein